MDMQGVWKKWKDDIDLKFDSSKGMIEYRRSWAFPRWVETGLDVSITYLMDLDWKKVGRWVEIDTGDILKHFVTKKGIKSVGVNGVESVYKRSELLDQNGCSITFSELEYRKWYVWED